MPKLTIILPSYNHQKFLKQRLDSIINQTFTDWQLIIIDDNSTDGSIDVLKNFTNDNKSIVKHLVINPNNSGSGYNSWKKGIELADTEYIWIAETDDYSAPSFLLDSINALEKNKKSSLCFCASNYIDKNGNFLYDSSMRTLDLDVHDGSFKSFKYNVLIDNMPFKPYITNGSSVVFRTPFDKIPNEIFLNKQSSDIFLWTFLVKNNEFVFLNKKLNYFRRHKESTTEKNAILRQQSVYFEKAKYLNFYNQKDKNSLFIEYYVNYYIKKNKNRIFDIKPILAIKGVYFLRIKYIFIIIKHFFKWMIP